MLAAIVIILVVVVLGGLIVTGRSLRVVQQYEQGIVFRFGKVLPGTRGPGLTILRPIGDRMQKVNMQIIAMAVPAQEGITRDNVSVRVDAVVYFRVVDPIKAVVNVQNYMFAVSQQAQTSLRSIIGQSEMDQLLAERDTVNRELRQIIDEPTEGPWGIRVERVELKDVNLPEEMKRSMSRQAEAERERRARIISADGEYQASKRLAAAANVMARDPAALQLRLLQTVVEVAAEKNSTLVMPVPVELLRFFDRNAPVQRHRQPRPLRRSRTPATPSWPRPRRPAELGSAPLPEIAERRRQRSKRRYRRSPTWRYPSWTRRPSRRRPPRRCEDRPPRASRMSPRHTGQLTSPARPAPVRAAQALAGVRRGAGYRRPRPGRPPTPLGFCHAEMGVRDGAVAGACDQADPGQLGRRRLGTGGAGARAERRAAGRLHEAAQGGRVMAGSPEERLAALGLELPAVAPPQAAYLPALRTGNYVYTAGQLPMVGRRS